ncbi:hypothetical protein K440DRAFT_636005 [Wilcoxina mikolae CBS 423.85]|nr:hypothetical protein K440DRAFT_636005 [Wilcoxina mikolae CBS 423.85]
MSLNSSPLSTSASQSSSRSQAADHGSDSSTGRQLPSSTWGNDTGPAADTHPTPPDTQDTINLSQAALRAVAENMQSTPIRPNTNLSPPVIDINTVLTSSTAELARNNPMLLSILDMFPEIDTKVVQSIYTNQFRAENLLDLEASFTYQKKRPQFYSLGTGEYCHGCDERRAVVE